MVNMNGQYIIKIVISHEKFALQTKKKRSIFSANLMHVGRDISIVRFCF